MDHPAGILKNSHFDVTASDNFAEAEGCGFLRAGNAKHVLRGAVECARDGRGVLALVLETAGSTYAREGAMALFDGEERIGWLSGGCLEPELARRAADADSTGRIDWMEIDTRADE